VAKSETVRFAGRTHRFGNHIYPGDLPGAQSMDARQLQEAIDFFRKRGEVMSIEEFKAKSFQPHVGVKSRFTDGSYGLFYSALEPSTAEAEAYDAFHKIVAGKTAKKCFYFCFGFDFAGVVLDLLSAAKEMPELVDVNGYDKCIELAKKARGEEVDALLTPSAATHRRSQQGTCLPVFSANCLTGGAEESSVVFTYPPQSGD
jgi:hypothetical protein